MEGMKWNHLPEGGGLYAQHPRLLEELSYIFSERSKEQEKQRKEQERKNKASGRVAGRGRR